MDLDLSLPSVCSPFKPSRVSELEYQPLQTQLLASERDFYHSYPWCLNPFPTVREVVEHLRGELGRLDQMQEEWQRAEVMTNIWLLSCAISNSVDDYLRGESYEIPRAMGVLSLAAKGVRTADRWVAAARNACLGRSRQWRERWETGVEGFVELFATGGWPAREAVSDAATRLATFLAGLPADLLDQPIKAPSALQGMDLTPFDVKALGRKFVTAFPDRQHPILVVGLRTAGSYFAPVLRAYLKAEGYQHLDAMTLRPCKGIGPRERAQLAAGARREALAVLVDDPPSAGDTLAHAVEILRQAGFAARHVAALVPVHPTGRGWKNSSKALALTGISVLILEPEEWYKPQLFELAAVERRLQEYFEARGYQRTRVVASKAVEQLNAQLVSISEETRRTRLKRIYEVRLQDQAGRVETRYVLAKSVGWGYWAYRACLAGDHLSRFVPPILGLRDGILYTEWLPQADHALAGDGNRSLLVRSAASYVAARVCSLGLEKDPAQALTRTRQDGGFALLAKALSRAYGSNLAAILKRDRIRHELSRLACPSPTLIDGKMWRTEWISGPSSLLKADFEHHGLGKNELNVTDPAYDLAEAILHLGLSESDERALLGPYIEESGDAGVESRLFLYKLLAGLKAMAAALENQHHPRLSHRHQEFNRLYIDAWNFLTLHTTRFCAGFCQRPEALRWHNPLAVLDIDGVLDRRVFGFPSTTAAGIQAVSLLHAHDFAVAVNTARTLREVKEYCKAYGFVGGVAEYGSAIWDAVGSQARVLVSSTTLDQLAAVRKVLREIPGVFLDDGYQYSIRAYTYQGGATVALPALIVQEVMARLKADRLVARQNTIDTAIVAREVDKGSGLLELLTWVGQPDLETLVVGDSEPDLAMFRVANRSFAPSQIRCRLVAKSLGCQIADRSCQPGLLSIVRSLVHPDGSRCERCRSCQAAWLGGSNYFLELLEVADQPRPTLLLRALLDPMAVQAFVK